MGLRPGKTTPQFVEDILAVFGNNPHGEPLFRLIWSERKTIWFMGEPDAPEYIYFDPAWVLETWIPPELDAGTESSYTAMGLAFAMGPYPHKGTYNYVKRFPADWEPSEEHVRLLAKGIELSRHLPIKERKDAIVGHLERQEKENIQRTAEAAMELFDSAARGKVQQAMTGPINKFRTVDDYVRDMERAPVVRTPFKLPKAGGKLIQ